MVSKTIKFDYGILLEILSYESENEDTLTADRYIKVYYDVHYRNEVFRCVLIEDALDRVNDILYRELERKCKREREQARLDSEYNELMEEIERRGFTNRIVPDVNDEQEEEDD